MRRVGVGFEVDLNALAWRTGKQGMAMGVGCEEQGQEDRRIA